MRKVIDLCLDMPHDPESVTNILYAMCFDKTYEGYKNSFAPKIADTIGLNLETLDMIMDEEGEEGFLRKVSKAAKDHEVTLDDFVKYMDETGIEWGITVSNDHDNDKTAEIIKTYPGRFKGFIFVDPNNITESVRELERSVKDLGLHALYLTGFRTKLPANHKKNYPLYAKCCELDIPVHIYSSLNLSSAVPYDIGHPRYIDEVARDFPGLKIMAGVSGWPWVLEFLTLGIRHKNVYLNFETHAPEKMNKPGSGYEPYIYYASEKLSDRICFASNWTTQTLSVGDLVKQVEDLPLDDRVKDNILYNNAKRFYEEK